jgi:hypothetical protein
MAQSGDTAKWRHGLREGQHQGVAVVRARLAPLPHVGLGLQNQQVAPVDGYPGPAGSATILSSVSIAPFDIHPAGNAYRGPGLSVFLNGYVDSIS